MSTNTGNVFKRTQTSVDLGEASKPKPPPFSQHTDTAGLKIYAKGIEFTNTDYPKQVVRSQVLHTTQTSTIGTCALVSVF